MGSIGSNQTMTESNRQLEEAKFEGWRRNAKYFSYTDYKGDVITGETGRATGGTYITEYDSSLNKYRNMSVSELQAEAQRLKAVSDDNYQRFARSAASKSSSQVRGFTDADIELRKVNQVLRSKKRG